jgi:predicted RNA-binding Zn ribbon-like protein
LWPVAHAATALLTSGDLDRLKLCAGCHWVFLDSSRNHSRRWCTMEVCGTDEKKRRYVAKRAARRRA